MSPPSVLDQIRKLVEIQKLDAQIYDIRKELKEKPALLEQLKQEFEAQKANLNTLEEKSKAVQVSRKSLEGDLMAKEEAIAKANMQLSQIKTNKEYTAKLSEIENIKADKSMIEEKILISYDDVDKIKADIEKEKGILDQKSKKYQSSKQEIEGHIKELEDRLKVLQSQRKQITPDIEKELLNRYEKILVNKEGLAIVPVEGTSCGGCFMNVPAQIINEMKMHDKLIYCEMCSRILYLKEDFPD